MQGYDTIPAELEQACAQEPIHLLGTVQPHGFLIAAEVAGGRIVQVSSGIARHWPGLSVDVMLGTPLLDWIERAAPFDALGLDALPPAQPLALPWRARFERTAPARQASSGDWECLGHRSGDIAVLEWLPQATSAERLRADGREFADIAALIARLRHADRIGTFLDDCAKVVQGFTGFDRVMIYRFLPDGAGEVIAEQCDERIGQRFVGLRFPASDIPAQARELYLTNRLRMLADVEAAPDKLVPPALPGGAPLDQSHCVLRGLSPVHLSYLRNMGVRATLTMSIVIDAKLWGLIACHHLAPKSPPYQVREALRQLCELTAEVATMRIETLSKLEAVDQRLAMSNLLSQFHQSLLMGEDITALLRRRLPELLKAFRADTLGVYINSTSWIGGPGRRQHPAQQAITEVLARLDRVGHAPGVLMWDDLLTDGQRALASLPEAAGMLLAHRFEDHPIFCFVARPEVVQLVRWAGQPLKEIGAAPGGQVRLEPRRSFAEWQQQVKGRSEPWTAVEAEGLQSLLQILSEVNKLRVNRTLHEKLHWRAHHDQLTGLYNRRTMEDEVTRRLEDGQFDVALMLLDLDHFKKINDAYGHATGDQVLLQFGRRLGAVIRDCDLLARLGGDEFMLLFQMDQPNAANALMFAERLQQTVTRPFDINGQQLRMGVSIGIALPPAHGRTVGELLRRADLALYYAKAHGRSRSAVFDFSMESDQLDQYLLERDLGEAIEQNELSLVFQPKVDLATRRVVGMEALVRWNHPSRGQTPPAIFIPLAERSDQIVRIDRWVMRQALQMQARWRDQGLPPLPVSVNLSMADILSTDVVGYLSGLLDEFRMPADALEVEVTESAVMRELTRTRSVLAALNERGIGTALDDFGTGFSSLSYLRQLPLQSIKIDQSFTLSMLQDPNAETLTQAIVAMGVALKMLVVAEGVETEPQMDWLMEHGCHLGQGFFFSPPVSGDDIHAVIRGIELRLATAPPGVH
ncbi:MAG: EAL domain-containing protein [Pseudomonadota bacterium]